MPRSRDTEPAAGAPSSSLQIWRLSWPAVVQVVAVSLAFVVDGVLIGRHAPAGLASLQAATTATWTFFALASSVSLAALVLVARHAKSGARQTTMATRTSMTAALALGLVAGGGLWLARHAIAEMLASESHAEVARQAEQYMGIVALGIPAGVVGATGTACLQGAGRVMAGLCATAVAAVANLGISALLVVPRPGGPAMGIDGAAWGTSAAFGIHALVVLALLHAQLRGDVAGVAQPTLGCRRMAAELVGVGGIVAFERLCHHTGYVVFAVCIGKLGATAMAAHLLVVSVDALAYPVAEGFAIAAATIVGQRAGAGDVAQAFAGAKRVIGWAVMTLTVFGVAVLCAPDTFLSAFTSDPKVARAGAGALAMAAVAQPFTAFALVSAMTLRAAARPGVALLVSLCGGVAVRLPAAWLFTQIWSHGLTGAWLAATMDWTVQSALFLMLAVSWRRNLREPMRPVSTPLGAM